MALSEAILVALLDRTCSGYDLAKQFDGSVGFFWQASHQQIYRELSKLENQGLVEVELVYQDDRPNKKLYRVTADGKTRVRDWMLQPGGMSGFKDDLLVKVFGGALVTPAELIGILKQQRSHHQERLEDYQAIEAEYFATSATLSYAAQCQYLTLRNGLHYEQAWLDWCAESLQILEQEQWKNQ